jgi:tRNA threonylcarbamoyl adenosine modification protein YeaZ
MPYLGIDTASDDAAVAVVDGERVLAEHQWHIETTTSRELLARIASVLAEAGVARDALTGIAVDIGPGGYGGLRSGVATAQGLALGLGIPLAGVGRLVVDAFPHLSPGNRVVAVHDAGRGGVAWAAFAGCELLESGQAAPPEVLITPRIDPAVECVRLAPAPAGWCGEVTEALLTARDTASRGGDIDLAPKGRSAADVVRLAHLHRAFGDPGAVDVIYLRPPSIGARTP